MHERIYVIGHRNPDTDSIASAIGYAAFKQATGHPEVVAAMAGTPNPQTSYILKRFNITPPVLLTDVRPRVKDVIGRTAVTANQDLTLKEALELFHAQGIRVLPVVDGKGKPQGVVSLLKLSEKYLVAGTERRRGVDASVRSLLATLNGTLVSGEDASDLLHLHLFIGAMTEESFSQRIEGYDPATLVIMTGDRPSIQRSSIESGVKILIITGGLEIDAALVALAQEQGTLILSTPYDTATAAWLIRLATPIGCFMEERFERINLKDPLDQLRLALVHSREPAILVLDDEGRLAGVATKSSLLTPLPYALILVDHNELAQAVHGAESVEILAVIDHHKLGNPATHHPITFLAAPVGSTCTLVAGQFKEHGVTISQEIAGLLLAGIMSDTIILKSPTTTEIDRAMVAWLEPLSGCNHRELGREIFSACSGFKAHPSLEKAVTADFKKFSCNGYDFGVGQVEVVGFDEFLENKDQLRYILAEIRERDGLTMAGLMVTDIHEEKTLFLADSLKDFSRLMEYPQPKQMLFELDGVMSRKKQMIPLLMRIFSAL